MKIVLISDSFIPMKNSAAVQMRDLAIEFHRQGHQVVVLTPYENINKPWEMENIKGVQVLRLRAPKLRGISYLRRTTSELTMPFFMLYNLSKSPMAKAQWDGIVWYSPSIFHGILVRALKYACNCPSYLIVRDIFPQWAVDLGLMGRGLPFLFFSTVAWYQYSVADTIGIQSIGNKKYFTGWQKNRKRKLEVLNNWLDNPPRVRCALRIDETHLEGRRVFVYAGNMGVAQGLDIFIDLADKLRTQLNIGFLFVGRGSNTAHLKRTAREKNLDNIIFFDEIAPEEIPDLYAQCSAGIVSLDSRHKSHNIPGKFLTYMQCGLPVLANVNLGNDLAEIIRDARVGQVCENNTIENLVQLALKLLEQIEQDVEIPARCRRLFQREFTVDKTVRQIIAALSP